MQIGTQVKLVDKSEGTKYVPPYTDIRYGTVVEVGDEESPKFAGRLRVLWQHGVFTNASGSKERKINKRTWVNRKSLQEVV